MSNEFTEKAVYYRRTTRGKTKWVKIEDVAFQEFRNRLVIYDYSKINTGRNNPSRQVLERDVA
tara:strand:+ start:303 stop:491 length:189 start_codon:yes stop_codon:yes gene_type:complete